MSKLPEPGDLFAFEVKKGLDLVLRVVDAFAQTRCVVVTKHSAPTLSRAPKVKAVFEAQAHSHHNWKRPVLGGWVDVAPPREVRPLGNVPVRPGEAERVVHPQTWVKLEKKPEGMAEKVVPHSGWDTLLDQARRQWRWDHEREAVLAEDARAEAANQAKFAAAVAAQGKYQEKLKKKGVAALKKTKFFASWKGEVPAPMIKAAEALLNEAVRSLVDKSPAQAAQRLKVLVRAFNKLDGRHERSFDTVDREDIMEAIGTVAVACGIDDETFESEIDGERDF